MQGSTKRPATRHPATTANSRRITWFVSQGGAAGSTGIRLLAVAAYLISSACFAGYGADGYGPWPCRSAAGACFATGEDVGDCEVRYREATEPEWEYWFGWVSYYTNMDPASDPLPGASAGTYFVYRRILNGSGLGTALGLV